MSARTAFYAPAHRVMGRVPPGSGGAAQPPFAAPSIDCGGSGLQDSRWIWNSGNSAASPQALGWYNPGDYPVIDVVPATATATSLAASQTPTAGVALTLVSSSGAGVVVSSSALFALPSGNTIPAGTLFVDEVPAYHFFGLTSGTYEFGNTGFYDPSTMISRAVRIHSAGDDTGATWTVTGYDVYGYPLTATVAGASAGDATTLKCFKAVTSITASGTLSGSAVTAGLTDVIGLPLYAAQSSQIWGFWNNLIITGAGTFVAGVTTSPSTAALGDVRGKYTPGSASDGSKRLTLFQRPSLGAMISSGINIGLTGQLQV